MARIARALLRASAVLSVCAEGARLVGQDVIAAAAAAAAGDAGRAAEHQCSSRLVTDATHCGAESVTRVVEDALACGWTTCFHGRFSFPCPRQCEQTVSRPRTCEIKAVCRFTLRVHVQGDLYVGSWENMSGSAEYLDYELVEGPPEVRALLQTEKGSKNALVESLTGRAMSSAVSEANARLKAWQTDFARDLPHMIAQVVSGMNTTQIGTDAVKAAQDTMDELLNFTEVHFHDGVPWGSRFQQPRNQTLAKARVPKFKDVFTDKLCKARSARFPTLLQPARYSQCLLGLSLILGAIRHEFDLSLPEGVKIDSSTRPMGLVYFKHSALVMDTKDLPWPGIEGYIEEIAVNSSKDAQPPRLVGARISLHGEHYRVNLTNRSWLDIDAAVDLSQVPQP